jgi:capsular polysaccharide biosynthesis protein
MSAEHVENSSSNQLESTNLLIMLFKWRKPIIIVCAAAAVLSAAVSLMIKPKYKSTVTLFATQQHSFGEQLLEDIKKEDVLAYGEEEDAERLLQLINSDQIRNRIISKYDLWTVYNIKREDLGANTLIALEYNDNITARLTKFGSIEVAVLDQEAKRAKEIANDIAALADTVSNVMRQERAQQAFLFAQSSLVNLEEELRVMEWVYIATWIKLPLSLSNTEFLWQRVILTALRKSKIKWTSFRNTERYTTILISVLKTHTKS